MPYIKHHRRMGLREPIDEKASLGLSNLSLGGIIASIVTIQNRKPDSPVEDIGYLIDILKRRFLNDGDAMTGDLNFCVCRLILGSTGLHEEPRYSKINRVNRILRWAEDTINSEWPGRGLIWERAVSVLDDVRLELYRRYAGPYEDEKKKENGDIID